MRLHIIVEIEEFPDLLLKNRLVLLPIFVMPDTLLTECPVETLNEGLLVLLVRTGIAVPFAVEKNLLMALRLEL